MSEPKDDAPKALEADDPEGQKPAFVHSFPPIRTPGPASYLEWSGVRQMTIVLAIICVAVVGFLAAWALTLPTIADVRALPGGASLNDPQAAEDVPFLAWGHGGVHRDSSWLGVTRQRRTPPPGTP